MGISIANGVPIAKLLPPSFPKTVAKSSSVADYPTQGRYGQGVITIRGVQRGAMLAGAATGVMDSPLVVVTSKGKPKYMRLGLAPRAGRNTQGEAVIALSGAEEVLRVVAFQPRPEF